MPVNKKKKISERLISALLRIRELTYVTKRYALLERAAKGLTESQREAFKEYDLVILDEKNIETIVRKQLPTRYKLFKQRLTTPNLHGVLSMHGDTCAGYVWYASGDYFEPDMKNRFTIDDRTHYVFDGFITPEYRRGYLASFIMFGALEFISPDGLRETMLSGVETTNRRALFFHAHVGFEERMQAVVVRYLFGVPFSSKLETYADTILPRKRRKKK